MNWLHLMLYFAALFLPFMETSFGVFHFLFGVQVTLLPALMVYTSLTHGIWTIVGVAIVGGLGFDSLSANPLGISILPLFLVGFTIQQCQGLLLRERPYAQFLLGGAASVVVPLITLFMLRGLDLHPRAGWGTLWHLLVMALGGALFAPLCFVIFDRVNRIFNYQPLGETSFRPDRQIKRGRY